MIVHLMILIIKCCVKRDHFHFASGGGGGGGGVNANKNSLFPVLLDKLYFPCKIKCIALPPPSTRVHK